MRRSHLLGLAIVGALAACSGGGSSGPPGETPTDSGTAEDTGTGSDDGGTPGDDSGTGGDDGGGTMNDGGPEPGCAGFAYCDDFEKYGGAVMNGAMLGPWMASVAGGATMTVDNVKPYRGTKGLHITAPTGTGARGTLHQQATAGLVQGNDLYGRAMVYYSNTGGNGLPLMVHSWLFNATGMSTAAMGNVTMNLGGGGDMMQLNYHPPPPLTEKSKVMGMITAGAWHCIEWQYDGSGTPPADDAKIWVDGTLADEAPKTLGWNFATPWSAFDFGFTHYQTLMNPVDVYLDDFALNGTRIGCPK